MNQEVLDAMESLAQKHHPNEVGTSLIGTYSEDGHVAKITGLAPHTKDSIGRRTTFLRGSAGLKNFFSALFQRSHGNEFYVGEWHSHPGGYPQPSGIDDDNAFAIARDPKEHCPECILAILAINTHVEIGVFVYSGKSGRTALLKSPSPD